MFCYITKRLLSIIPVIFIISLVVFGFIRLLSDDPARLAAGIDANAEVVEAMRSQLGLDKPVWQQYGQFCCPPPNRYFSILNEEWNIYET